jgi:hypothetical protein
VTPSHAHAARAVAESALDAAGWPWSLALSRWLDVLVVLEEQDYYREAAS